MTLKIIASQCTSCSACEPECPNVAIYEKNGTFVINPKKCTECIGHFDVPQCAAVCPVDCCVPDPNHVESEELLFQRAKEIHPERAFADLGATTSHFRK